ncbi:MAG TPA: hypothetical protein VMV15_05015 [Candidatus Binataceae bacterium]|nr:hypothetical protein [Candidatus Binataceae bacterium]
MSQTVRRNAIVDLLGTPDRTEGSLNDPRLYDENGLRFNEKWIYRHLTHDPAGVPMRIIYWWRYDFVGTVIRAGDQESWRADSRLAEAAANDDPRLAPLNPANNLPVTPSNQHRPASICADETDLGGHREGDDSLV